MSYPREFDDNLGHAGADANILNAFKRSAHEHSNIGDTAASTVYKSFPDGKRFRTAGHGNVNEKTSATSSVTNDIPFNKETPVSCASNGNVTMHSSTNDMTKDMTRPKHLRMLVREFVKTVLFRRLKFYKKLVHGLFDFRIESVMARLLRHCNVDRNKVTVQWWNDISKVLGTTLTDHRNNVLY